MNHYKRAPEGGIIKFDYSDPVEGIRIKNEIRVDREKAVMKEEIEHYKTNKLKAMVLDKINREENFPCFNENKGPVDMKAEYTEEHFLNIEIELSQENGQCWLHETSIKRLENMIGIELTQQDNKLKGSALYMMLINQDDEGNMMPRRNLNISRGASDPHPPEYYQLFITIMDTWEYIRRQVKTAI